MTRSLPLVLRDFFRSLQISNLYLYFPQFFCLFLPLCLSKLTHLVLSTHPFSKLFLLLDFYFLFSHPTHSRWGREGLPWLKTNHRISFPQPHEFLKFFFLKIQTLIFQNDPGGFAGISLLPFLHRWYILPVSFPHTDLC